MCGRDDARHTQPQNHRCRPSSTRVSSRTPKTARSLRACIPRWQLRSPTYPRFTTCAATRTGAGQLQGPFTQVFGCDATSRVSPCPRMRRNVAGSRPPPRIHSDVCARQPQRGPQHTSHAYGQTHAHPAARRTRTQAAHPELVNIAHEIAASCPHSFPLSIHRRDPCTAGRIPHSHPSHAEPHAHTHPSTHPAISHTRSL